MASRDRDAHAKPGGELEIKYPELEPQQSAARGYLFRLALSATTREADKVNTAFNRALTDEDGILLHTANTCNL